GQGAGQQAGIDLGLQIGRKASQLFAGKSMKCGHPRVIQGSIMNDRPKNGRPLPALSLTQAHARLTAPGEAFETVEITVRGLPMQVWKHVPATAAEAFVLARQHGGREFLVYQDERVSYDGFARASLAVAALLAERGLRKGDRVALVMRNLPEWPVVFLGA